MASHDAAELGVGSRLIANCVAALYDQHLPHYARGRLIDLGCGKAPLYGAYRTLVDDVVCVDWTNSPHANLHVDYELDLSRPLPFPDASFETIILSDVLEHVPQPELLWNEMARMLVPGGTALINVPFLYGVHEAPHDYYRYTEFALRRFAERAGMAIKVLEPIGGSLHVLVDLVAKHLTYVPLIGASLAAGLQAAVASIDRTGVGRRATVRTGRHFPLGYFIVAERPTAES